MSQRYFKKIRKEVKKKISADLGQAVRSLGKEKLYWRVVYALRIIFNFHPDPKFLVKKTEDPSLLDSARSDKLGMTKKENK